MLRQRVHSLCITCSFLRRHLTHKHIADTHTHKIHTHTHKTHTHTHIHTHTHTHTHSLPLWLGNQESSRHSKTLHSKKKRTLHLVHVVLHYIIIHASRCVTLNHHSRVTTLVTLAYFSNL